VSSLPGHFPVSTTLDAAEALWRVACQAVSDAPGRVAPDHSPGEETAVSTDLSDSDNRQKLKKGRLTGNGE